MNATTNMIETLKTYGPRFVGNDAADAAEDWIDHGFMAETADGWCQIGVWDAAIAAELRDAGCTPDEVVAAAESLGGDPIYAACNGDITADVILDAIA